MITLWGMYQWDNTILSNMQLPPGMDTKIMIDLLMERAGELPLYYQNPDIMRRYSDNWFTRKLYNFTLMYNALVTEYSPLHNYDRVEDSTTSPDITRVETPNITRTHKGDNSGISSTISHDTSNTTTSGSNSSIENGTGSQNGTVTQNVSAFDVATYSPREQTITDNTNGSHNDTTGTSSSIGKIENDGTLSGTASSTDNATDTESGTRTHTEQGQTTYHSEVRGNIGVTTSQQMLQSELDLRLYDLYEVIAQLWIDDFIVMVY